MRFDFRYETKSIKRFAIGLSRRGCGDASANDAFCEALHLFELRAELQEDQVDTGGLELGEPLGNLFRRPHQA